MIFSFISCNKKEVLNFPEVAILLPNEGFTFSALDTILVKISLKDDIEGYKYLSFLIQDEHSNQTFNVRNVTVYGKEFVYEYNYVLNERWINSGEYLLVVNVNNGKLSASASKKILISAIPKKFKGIIAGVGNSSNVDIYVSDTTFNFNKVFSLSNLYDAYFDYYNSQFYAIFNDGVVRFYTYPEFFAFKEITGFKKVGVPFKTSFIYEYPYFYVCNSNGYVWGIDKDGNVRQVINTLFSPYKLGFKNNEWIILSDTYPYDLCWIEVPLQQKNYQFSGKLVDLLNLNKERWVIVEQKNNKVIWYEYKSLYNLLDTLGKIENANYNCGLEINGKVYFSINNKIFLLNKIYGTIYEVFNGIRFEKLKFDDVNTVIVGVDENKLYILENETFNTLRTLMLPNKIIFYSFIYE